MNFDDDQQGPQRPISAGSGSLDEKIAGSPSPYPSSSREKRSGDAGASEDGEPVVLRDADVLCGRGKASFNHAGNKRFRDIITDSIPEYNQSDSRLEKSLVVHAIVESVQNAGGRFLKGEEANGEEWIVLDDRACRDKVSHAIRDAATTTESRRQKKLKQQAVPTNMLLGTRGPISRYQEMKMDTPEPVSFHDMVNSSFNLGRPSAFPAHSRPLGMIHYSRLGPAMLSGTTLSSAPVPPAQHQLAQLSSLASTNQGREKRQRLNNEVSPYNLPGEVGFMEDIAAVLGPMPPNHDVDPLADLLDLS